MATYKELVQVTRLICGMQGTGPTSVVGATGAEEVLVRFVRQAYVDIQNRREEWDFLLKDKVLTLQPSKGTYSLLDIFATATPEFKKYKRDSFILTDGGGRKEYLNYIERDSLEAQFLNNEVPGIPRYYTVNPTDKSLIFKSTPNSVYTLNFRYYRSPEVLLTDSQVPSLPISFHNLIVYTAAAKMAVYLGSPEIYQEYSRKAEEMMGQLMRLEVPKKRMRPRPMV